MMEDKGQSAACKGALAERRGGRLLCTLRSALCTSRGSAIYELIIKTIVFITLIATVISFLSVFTVYINLNYTCRRVVRSIELDGQVTAASTDLFNQLKTRLNVGDASMTVSNVTYHDASKKIQLRQTFTVELRSEYDFLVFRPLFTSETVVIKIPLVCSLSGMSERFWK